MSTRRRWLAVFLVSTAGFFLPTSRPAHAESEGEVGLRDLIVLALRNDPGLIALRNNISVEEARKRAAVQWRDPEIRLGYAKDDNLQLEQPYTRSGTVTETTTGAVNRDSVNGFRGFERSRNSGVNASGNRSQFGSASRTGTSTETRTTDYTEKVIPGRNADRIIRTETERRDSQSSVTEARSEAERRRSGGEVSRDKSRGVFNERSSGSEVYRTTTEETRYHGRDPFERDSTASVRVRFWIPKPWERKALINQAAKTIDLANYEITAAERQVILEVREQYEQLQFLSKKLEASRRQVAIIEEHVANQKELLDAGGDFTLDQLSFEEIKIPGIMLAIDAAETEMQAAKRVLAARVGLADGSRIRVTDKLLRSGIDLEGADLDYLTRMALAHRGELGILKHEQAIAEAELDVVKSKRIPWFSFIEGGYARDHTGGDFTNDNYGVQVGVVLPLFSWLAKDQEVVEARIDSFGASLEANQASIANEVAEAFRAVNDAGSYRARTEAAIDQHSRAMEEKAAGLEASEDLAARERLRYDTEIERYRFHDYLLAADRLFNQSLIRLERALGADLDQVFQVEFEPLGEGSADAYEVIATTNAQTSEKPSPPAKPVADSSDSNFVGGDAKPKRKSFFKSLKQ